MNKTELINTVVEKTELSKKDTTATLDAIVESIIEAVTNGDKVQLIGFGNFEPRNRKERKGRNPQDGTELVIPASVVPAFKPAKAFKDSVKQGS